jgi:hypothetical protein
LRFLQDYIEVVEVRVAALAQALAGGNATSFEDYRYRVGLIKGLQESLTILRDVYKATPPEERE